MIIKENDSTDEANKTKKVDDNLKSKTGFSFNKGDQKNNTKNTTGNSWANQTKGKLLKDKKNSNKIK